jgi:hypothetical protein
LLDIELKDVLAMAWNKYGVLAAAADASDDDTHQVALADHTISLTYRPTLEVTVDGVGRGTLEFSLTLEMTLKAIQLSIRGGRVVAVGSGTCEGNVKLELDDFTVLNRELPVVDLPGQLDLGNGIPITSSSHPEHVSKPVA